MITASSGDSNKDPMSTDGEDNDAEGRDVDHTRDYEDERVRDHASGALHSSSPEVADINNAMPTISYDDMGQTEEEPVSSIIELPLRVINCTDNINSPDRNAVKDYNAPRWRFSPREISPIDAAVNQLPIIEVD